MHLDPRDAVILDCLRTPMGRSKAGAFRHVRAERLSASLMRALIERHPQIDAGQIDDIIWGCVNQTLEQGLNVARMAALLADLPQSVPAQTVNRLCGSSMAALHSAAHAIRAEQGDIYLVGGVEHMGHVPMSHGVDIAPELGRYVARGSAVMGLTAEMLARKHGIARAAQDEFALRSHQRAHQASSSGVFAAEILPIPGHDAAGHCRLIEQDEVIRADTSLQALSQLPPVFDPQGSVTAGSSSALSDGAAAMLVLSAAKAQELGLKPMARVRGMSVAGLAPAIMGYGPVPASERALARAGLSLVDMDFIELNEAFAAQSLAVLQGLGLAENFDERVNVRGGAIALGHPLGCSGARITTTLLHVLHSRDAQFGLATLCIGMGQGIATVFERL